MYVNMSIPSYKNIYWLIMYTITIKEARATVSRTSSNSYASFGLSKL